MVSKAYRDEHASALEPAAAATKEGDDEHEDADKNGKGVDIKKLVLRKKCSVLRIAQPQPHSQPYHPASRQLQKKIKIMIHKTVQTLEEGMNLIFSEFWQVSVNTTKGRVGSEGLDFC